MHLFAYPGCQNMEVELGNRYILHRDISSFAALKANKYTC